MNTKIVLMDLFGQWCEALGLGGAVIGLFEKESMQIHQTAAIVFTLTVAVYLKCKAFLLKNKTSLEK